MIGGVLERKFTKRFSVLDRDRDGYIDRTDLIGIMEAILDAFGADLASDKGQRLMEAYLGWWDNLLNIGDTSGDSRISMPEYAIAVERGVLSVPGAFQRYGSPVIEAVFKLADDNEDHVLSRAEFRRLLAAWGSVPEAEAADAFRRLDLDGDGYLTREEMDQAAEQFWTSEDPDAPGNWLWGSF